MKSASVALLLLVCCWTLVTAQHYTASVKHYGPEQGLAHREVNAIFQDRQGFIWFGTRFGLSRFDGQKFTTYNQENNDLDFDDVQSIAQDAEGLLWLMGPFGQSKITIFNPQTGRVVSYKEKFKQKFPSLVLDNVQQLLGGADGSIFLDDVQQLLGGADGSIFFVSQNPTTLHIYQSGSGLTSIPLPQFKKFYIRRVSTRNTLWGIVDDKRVVELTTDGRLLRTYVHPGLHVQFCYGQRSAGTEFYYVVFNQAYPFTALYSVDESGRQREWPVTMLNAMLQDRVPVTLAINREGMLWDGIHLQDPKKGILLDIKAQMNGEPVTNRSFFRDRSGQFWLGTSFGVYQVRLIENYFQRLFFEPSSKGDKMAAVRGIQVIGDQVYANLEKFGLFVTGRSGGPTRALFEKSTFASMYGLGRDRQGRLYVGGNTEIFKYDRLPSKPTPVPGLKPLGLWAFYPYSDGQMLAGGQVGLWTIRTETGTIEAFTRYNQFTELAQAHVLYIASDRQGTLWVCANTGLYTVDPARGVTARYSKAGKGIFYLPANNFQHFYQDAMGIYWLATANSGLIRWNRSQQQYRQFRRTEGLSNNNIYAVYPDRRGRLWLSSDFGLMQFDPIRLTTRAYFVEDGITHNEFNRIAHYQDEWGRIYLGGLNGITAFDPDDFQPQRQVVGSPLRITAFRQFDRSAKKIVDKTDQVVQQGRIEIPPDDRSSVLEFALLNYANAEKNVYAYRFENLDKDWIYQSEPSLPLSSLPYGEHRLQIRAQAANGQWAANTLAITITVLRPFYLRLWFLVGMLLLLGAGVWGWLRWRIWQHQAEQRRLETEIKQATHVIEQQAQDLLRLNETRSRFFANISHEFRTPLTVILGMAASLNDKPDPQLHQMGELIERNGSNLLRLINQILDLSKLESGEMHLHPIRADLVSFTRYVGESFHSMAGAKGIQLHFLSDEETCEADFDKDKLQDIIANLLGNALKFTPVGGHVYCQLKVRDRWQPLSSKGYYEELIPLSELDKPWVQISVSDTGPGIDPEHLSKIFDRFYQAGPRQAEPTIDKNPIDTLAGGTGIGLALVRELVALMQGGLAVRNRPGHDRPGQERPEKGAEFVFSLPLTRQAQAVNAVLPAPILVSPDRSDWEEPESSPTDGKPVLLVVEDNDDVATYIRQCVENTYQVIWAGNGQAGIDMALERIPDLILSDVMMPLKDGFELCDTLKTDEHTSHIPIVLLTARAAVSDRISGLQRGADAYLVKPFQRDELLIVLGNLLKTRRLLQLHYSQLALGSVGSNPVPVPPADSVEDQFLIRLRDVIEPQLGNTELSVDDICQLIGMSRTTLHMKLTALTGMPVRLYLRKLRLRKAQELLATSPMNISEVAYAAGFGDPRYFSRVFAEEFGITPGNYRLSGRQ